MANKNKSFGVKLQRKTGTSTYADIPSLVDCKPPAESVELTDMTTHDSSGGYREQVASFKSGGNATATFLYDPADAQHIALHTDYQGTTKNTYKIVLPTTPAHAFTFDAFVTEWAPGQMGIDGRIEVSITLAVTGQVTIGAAA